ncbi:MAG: hypothetical protein U0T79_09295 [Ferruginibacter sp.]
MKMKLLVLLILAIPILSNAQSAKPIFKIGFLGTPRIWAPDFRNVENATIEMSDFSKSDYQIKEFTVTVLSDKTKTYKTIKNVGSKLNTEIRGMFSTLSSNDVILIDGIIITDSKEKNTYLTERVFRVR